MRRIAYIPARGGSKGIPRKNIRPLLGVPLLVYSIRAAADAGCFDRICVSTDSEEIAAIAEKYGAWIPFLRSAAFAGDNASIEDAIRDDLRRFAEIGEVFDTFCLLQPTSPLRTADDVRKAVEMCERRAEGVVGVSPVKENPVLMRTLSEDGRLSRVLSMPSSIRRQDMPAFYKVNGAVYCVPVAQLADGVALSDSPLGLVMSEESGIDIDDMEDFLAAEYIMRKRLEATNAQ